MDNMDTIYQIGKDIKKGGGGSIPIFGYHPPYREGYKERGGIYL